MSETGNIPLSQETLAQASPGSFPQTRWTLVRRASDVSEPDSFEALSKLCEDYWYPLYAFVRSQGAPPDDSSDEVQGFFAALVEKDFLEAADRDKGKLRTFLIDAIKKYRAKEYRAKQAQKRGGGQTHLSINQEWAEGRYEAEPVDNLTPEQILDRSWARLLLESVMKRLGEDFSKKGKEEEFEVLKDFMAWNSAEISYADAASKLGISEGNLKVRVHRLRARYRELLEDEVRQTMDQSEAGSIDQELRHLLSALG
tara:strand:- start:2668 stop:3435 length:768 start_codon:yes stop_codon:yes gene_type:complete